MNECTIPVRLPSRWSDEFAPEDFYAWTTKNNIQDTEWNFTVMAGITEPTLWFKKKEDAVAFKLRFNV